MYVALTCRQHLTFWQGEWDFLSVIEVLLPVSVGFWQGSPTMVPRTPPGALHPGWWRFALGGKEHIRRAACEASSCPPALLRWKQGLKGRSGEYGYEHPNLQWCPWRKTGSGIVVFYPSCREALQLLCGLWCPIALCHFCCYPKLPRYLVTRWEVPGFWVGLKATCWRGCVRRACLIKGTAGASVVTRSC